ncbi:MAG: ROK family protein [Pirellulales bacterium]|nr:ROK family protein [Pirellulales bacterium]
MNSTARDHWVGFDLGGTKMLAVALNSADQPVGRARTKTRGAEGSAAGIKRIVGTIHEALQSANVDVSRLAGIGVGCPGPLDLDRGILLNAPNLGWKDVPLKQELENAFGCPAVIANDVDIGVYGEYRFGAARGAFCALGIFPGTGIGGGCVYRGEILRGKIGSCMEVGHMRVAPEGPRCGCGQRGCLEAVASRLAICGAAVQAVYRGEAPALAEACGTDLSNIRSKALARSVAAGDVAIERILRDAARTIGVGLASVVALLSPDCVVLGGGLVEAMPELFVDEVESAARDAVLPSFRDVFEVRAAELGDDAAVRGAAALARQHVEQITS